MTIKKVFVEGLDNKVSKSFRSFSFGLFDKQEGKIVAINTFTSCRAFMVDALLKLKFPKSRHIPCYVLPEKYNYKKDSTLVGVSLNTEKQKADFISNILFVQDFEKRAGVKPCKYYKTQNPWVIMVEASPYWKKNCWSLILYTFFLKCSASKGTERMVDRSYWNSLMKTNKEGFTNETILLSKVKSKLPEIFDEDLFVRQAGAHNYEGFVSICSGYNPPMAKQLGVTVWQK